MKRITLLNHIFRQATLNKRQKAWVLNQLYLSDVWPGLWLLHPWLYWTDSVHIVFYLFFIIFSIDILKNVVKLCSWFNNTLPFLSSLPLSVPAPKSPAAVRRRNSVRLHTNQTLRKSQLSFTPTLGLYFSIVLFPILKSLLHLVSIQITLQQPQC